MAVLAWVGTACGERPGPPPPSDPDPVEIVREDDLAMNSAISEARAHLDVFDRALAAAEPGRVFTVKKAFPTSTPLGREHIWITDVRPAAGGYRGRVDSDPRDVDGLRYGDVHFVARSEVTDWMISDGRARIWGGYTMRALLPSLPAEHRREMEAALQPLGSEVTSMRAESEVRREAAVVGPGAPGFLKINLGRRRGSAGDGIFEVPVDRIPSPLRTPNSRFVAVTVPGGVARVEEESVGRPKLEVEESVRRVLNRWDPIGVADDVDDEYDFYIQEILALLRSGADDATIAKHLLTIEKDRMGLGGGSWKDRLPIAAELRRLPLAPP